VCFKTLHTRTYRSVRPANYDRVLQREAVALAGLYENVAGLQNVEVAEEVEIMDDALGN
jgi:hypothetical protein